MDPQQVVDLGRDAIVMTLVTGAPVLLAGLIVGLIVGLLQAVTQVQEQTVSFVPKLVAMLAVLTLCMPWLITRFVDYFTGLVESIPGSL